jgi:hypothetical protein
LLDDISVQILGITLPLSAVTLRIAFTRPAVPVINGAGRQLEMARYLSSLRGLPHCEQII